MAVLHSSIAGQRALVSALDLAAQRGVLVLAAAGNEGTLWGSTLTAHPWVIPVAASSPEGRPSAITNLGRSIGTLGLLAPGESVVSLAPDGPSLERSGTSVAVPFVTGAAALLWSEFPSAQGAEVKSALVGSSIPRRLRIIPPLIDVAVAYRALQAAHTRRKGAAYGVG